MMTPARILGTFESLPGLTSRDMRWLHKHGVEAEALPLHGIKAAYVHLFGSRFLFDQHYQHDGALRVLTMLSFDLLNEPVDILVWNPRTDVIASWLGVAWSWGEETILRPRLNYEALPIYRTPLGRLRAKLDGIVPLRPRGLAHHLLDVPSLVAEDWAHRSELQRLLRASLPRVLVRAEGTR